MTSILATLVLSAITIAVRSDTVHFTNSPSHLKRTSNFTSYKLDVPGSEGITIIEANNNQFPSEEDQDEPLNSFVKKQHHDINVPVGPKKMVYAPELLNKFIREYAEKTKSAAIEEDRLSSVENSRVDRYKVHHNNKKIHQASNDSPFDNKEGWVTLEAVPWSRSQVSKWKPNSDTKNSATMSSVSLYNMAHVTSLDKSHVYYGASTEDDAKFSKYPTKRPNFYQEREKDEGFYDRNVLAPNKSGKPKSQPQRKKDSGYYADREPELELSSNNDRWYDYGFRPNMNGDEDPKPDPYQSDEISIPPRNGYHSNTKRDPHRDEVPLPNRNGYLTNNKRDPYRDEIPLPNRNGYHSNPKRDPYIDEVQIPTRNGYHSNQKRDPHRDELPTPTRNPHQSGLYGHNTDYVYEARPESIHPATHPSNGNGEWVLVSTTKGYQYPSRTQRGISFNAPLANAGNYSVKTHKSIKLTVLPAEATASNKRPMTTSHGGLLEVDSSLQTVENSALKASKTKAKTKNKSKTKSGRRTAQMIQAVPFESSPKSDSTAVLAAVGAGMVPATVAMLMPMLGRKKREAFEPIDGKLFY